MDTAYKQNEYNENSLLNSLELETFQGDSPENVLSLIILSGLPTLCLRKGSVLSSSLSLSKLSNF